MKKRALIIGLNYFNSENRETGNHLSAKSASTLYRERFHITDQDVLIDGSKKVTKQDILNSFDTLLKDTNRGDILIFHYVGKSRNNSCIVCGDDDEEITIDEFNSLLLDPLPEKVSIFIVFDSWFGGLNLRYCYEDFSTGKMVSSSSGKYKTCVSTNSWKSNTKTIEKSHISPLHTNVLILSSKSKSKGLLTSVIVQTFQSIYAYSLTLKLLMTYLKSNFVANGVKENVCMESGQHLDSEIVSIGDLLCAPI
jgi:hypothetical protein